MDAGEGFAEIVERNAISGGVSAAGAERHAGGAGEGLTIAGEGDPKAAADFLRRSGADGEGERAVIVGEEGGVDGVKGVLGVEENLAEGASRAVCCRE